MKKHKYKIGILFKDYKKELKSSYINIRGQKKQYNWKKRWLPFIKYDKDFDGTYFIELIVYKLHLMLDFYSDPANCMQTDETRLPIVESLSKACELGDAIVNDSFFDEALDVLMKHQKMYIEKLNNSTSYSQLYLEWDSEENEKLYRKLDQEAQEKKQQTVKEFFKLLCDNYEYWWD